MGGRKESRLLRRANAMKHGTKEHRLYQHSTSCYPNFILDSVENGKAKAIQTIACYSNLNMVPRRLTTLDIFCAHMQFILLVMKSVSLIDVFVRIVVETENKLLTFSLEYVTFHIIQYDLLTYYKITNLWVRKCIKAKCWIERMVE